MLYSRYYAPGSPPTTQEEQAKMLAERVIPQPTTEEDQLKAAGYQQPELIEVAENVTKDAPEGVSEAIEARVAELVASQTVSELREIAKQHGLDIPPRIKEETLARIIAIHEQGEKQ